VKCRSSVAAADTIFSLSVANITKEIAIIIIVVNNLLLIIFIISTPHFFNYKLFKYSIYLFIRFFKK
jgi:hypothetical protein